MNEQATPPADPDKVKAIVGQWISVEDRLPSPSAVVLFVSEGTVHYGHRASAIPLHLMWLDHVNRDRDGDFDDVWNVTHWMPIPPPPNKTGERICEPSAGSKYAPADGSEISGGCK